MTATSEGQSPSIVKKLILKADPWALAVWVSALIAFLGVFSGGLASIYTTEIKAAFPFLHFGDWENFFYPGAYGDFSPQALTFWVGATLFFGLVFWRDSAVSRKQQAEQRRLKSAYADVSRQIDDYTNLLRTQPPKDFMYVYRSTYLKSRKAAQLGMDAAFVSYGAEAKAVVEEAVRTVLTGLVDLARLWDSPIPKSVGTVVYRANVMLYRPWSDFADDELKQLWGRRRFFVDTNLSSAIASLDGVLDLPDNVFTTTTETRNPDPDPSITPFALPVSIVLNLDDSTRNVREVGKRIQNIPGAPAAFAKQKSDWVLDKQGMIDKCDGLDGLTGEVRDEIRRYYSEDTSTSSIASFPLVSYDKGGSESIGVLNIYRNKDSILRNEERAEEFDAIIQPFCHLLVDLVLTYSTLQDEAMSFAE